MEFATALYCRMQSLLRQIGPLHNARSIIRRSPRR